MNLMEPQIPNKSEVRKKKPVFLIGLIVFTVVLVLIGGYVINKRVGLTKFMRKSVVYDTGPEKKVFGRVRVAQTMYQASATLNNYGNPPDLQSPFTTYTQILNISDIQDVDPTSYHDTFITYGLLDLYTTAKYKNFLLKIYDGNIFVMNRNSREITKYSLPIVEDESCTEESLAAKFWKISADPIGKVHLNFSCTHYPNRLGYSSSQLLVWEFNPTNGEFTPQGGISNIDMSMARFNYELSLYRDDPDRVPELLQGIYEEQIVHTFDEAYYYPQKFLHGGDIFNYKFWYETKVPDFSKFESFNIGQSSVVITRTYPDLRTESATYIYGIYTDEMGNKIRVNLINYGELYNLATNNQEDIGFSISEGGISKLNDTTLLLKNSFNPKPGLLSNGEERPTPEYTLDLTTGELVQTNVFE